MTNEELRLFVGVPVCEICGKVGMYSFAKNGVDIGIRSKVGSWLIGEIKNKIVWWCARCAEKERQHGD